MGLFAAVLLRPRRANLQSLEGVSSDIRKAFDECADFLSSKLPNKMPSKRSHECCIELKKDATLQKGGVYRLPVSQLKELRHRLGDILQQDFIRHSKCSWGAPILFVTKKDGILRLCVDCRALNRLKIENSYPLPGIDDSLDQLGVARHFTEIDLSSGYHQTRLEDSSVPLAAFRTLYGHFGSLVLPFALTSAPATFMTLVIEAQKEYIDKFVVVYLDEILVYSKT